MEVDISEFSLSFLPINNIITNYHACTSYRLYASITATILDKIVETHERSYVIFGRARIILFAPPPHTPQLNVVDMIPMLRTCSCRIMSTLNCGGEVYNKNCEHLNQSRRARVSCLQNFNVSQQVLSKIVGADSWVAKIQQGHFKRPWVWIRSSAALKRINWV